MTADTVYDPDSRNQLGMMQKSGECMVADGMPATAIAINFVSNGISVTKVEYAPSLRLRKSPINLLFSWRYIC